MHLYYRDSKGRGNGTWEAHGCSGEVRGARGYVVLWDDPWKLVSALGNPPPGAVSFPSDLFEAVGRPLKTADLHDPTFSKNPNNRPDPNRPLIADLSLEKIYPGGRHSALFDVVRAWAYKQELGRDLEKWRSWSAPLPSGQTGDSRFHTDTMSATAARSPIWPIASPGGVGPAADG